MSCIWRPACVSHCWWRVHRDAVRPSWSTPISDRTGPLMESCGNSCWITVPSFIATAWSRCACLTISRCIIVDLKDFPEPGLSWMALTPDDSLLLHRGRRTQEIYLLTL